MSDRVPLDRLPTLEERMDDVRAVMDAVGSERAALFGFSEGGAAERPVRRDLPGAHDGARRCTASSRSAIWSPDYPWAPTPEAEQRRSSELERTWGGRHGPRPARAERDDDALQATGSPRYLRRSASPGAAVALLRMNTQIDVRDVLPAIRVPTLVLHRDGRPGRRASRRAARSPRRSRAHASSSCRATTTCSGAATPTPSSTRSRSS